MMDGVPRLDERCTTRENPSVPIRRSGHAGWDPALGSLASRGEEPHAHLRSPARLEVHVAQQGALVQALLSANLQVTALLARHQGEEIEVRKISQVVRRVTEGCAELELAGEGLLLERAVALQGVGTGEPLLFARSTLVLERLPGDVSSCLLNTNRPLGPLLQGLKVPITQAVRWVGEIGEAPFERELFSVPRRVTMFAREYTLALGTLPFGIIREVFPASSFENEDDRC